MKKIMNDPALIVDEMLCGMAFAHREQLMLLEKPKVIVRRSRTKGKVALLSGGGTGHEPAHAGYVGRGMLDAAVCGNVFASPSADQILEGIQAADNGAGTLLIVKNYSGDIMNFDVARELVDMDGIKTATVVVEDDVAIPRDGGNAGRRGIAGTVFVHKLAGAAAERGDSLEQVEAVARKAVENVRTMGMSLSPCTVPEAGKQRFTIGENEMELGMGIHGEPGVLRCEILPAREVVERILKAILEDMPLSPGSETAVLINGLGATPLMELYVVAGCVREALEKRQISIHSMFVGNYMTSLEMAGCSVSLLKLEGDMKELLDAPADTPAFFVR